MVRIRPARAEDGPDLRRIERLAGERFRSIGMERIADDEPASVEELGRYAAAGRNWVAVDEDGEAVGYVLVDEVDADAHVEQISVRPDQQGRGVGRALLDRVREWAVQHGRDGITLTTFSEVPWNRPLYEHLVFEVLSEEQVGPGLRAVRDAEAAHGLDPDTRVCMRLAIADAP